MKLVKLGLFAATLVLTAVSTAGEVEDGSTWKCGPLGEVSVDVDHLPTSNDAEFTATINGQEGTTTTGSPGPSSTVAEPTVQDTNGTSAVDHDNDPTTPNEYIRVRNGYVQYINEDGDWVNGREKKKKKKLPQAPTLYPSGVGVPFDPPRPNPTEEVTSLPQVPRNGRGTVTLDL